jgi:hypothetical protein
LLNTLKEELCRGGHREGRQNFENSVRLCQEGIEQCTGCIEKELYFEFSEKTESLKIL